MLRCIEPRVQLFSMFERQRFVGETRIRRDEQALVSRHVTPNGFTFSIRISHTPCALAPDATPNRGSITPIWIAFSLVEFLGGREVIEELLQAIRHQVDVAPVQESLRYSHFSENTQNSQKFVESISKSTKFLRSRQIIYSNS